MSHLHELKKQQHGSVLPLAKFDNNFIFGIEFVIDDIDHARIILYLVSHQVWTLPCFKVPRTVRSAEGLEMRMMMMMIRWWWRWWWGGGRWRWLWLGGSWWEWGSGLDSIEIRQTLKSIFLQPRHSIHHIRIDGFWLWWWWRWCNVPEIQEWKEWINSIYTF